MGDGSASVVRADSHRLPLADETVDLIVSSPPYFGQRSYRDAGSHYDGQVGDETSPRDFLAALWAVTSECWRVLKPSGSMWVNLGDKRAGSVSYNNSGLTRDLPRSGNGYADGASRRDAPDRYVKTHFGRPKSKQLIPHRYAIGCEDGLADPEGVGWVVRQDAVWSKRNGMPESVQDRTRDSHEYWFHLTKQGDYYANLDALREPYAEGTAERYAAGYGDRSAFNAERVGVGYDLGGDDWAQNPLGRTPGSVWDIALEPFRAPDPELGLPAHFAAFPQEWPRRLILGWSPSGICTACGEGRRAITTRQASGRVEDPNTWSESSSYFPAEDRQAINKRSFQRDVASVIIGEVCACTPRTSNRGKRGDWKAGRREHAESGQTVWDQPGAAVPARRSEGGRGVKIAPPPDTPMWEYQLDGWTPPATRPAVVLDPFGGTGTTAGVARILGRVGLSFDLSFDYCRLAQWRIFRSGHFHKSHARTMGEAQGTLW